DPMRALYARLTKDGVDAWLDKEKPCGEQSAAQSLPSRTGVPPLFAARTVSKRQSNGRVKRKSDDGRWTMVNGLSSIVFFVRYNLLANQKS
ncbi:hypothetical protein GW866_06540, partial [bacterium]|nr:hypothetical protein [bacterium]